MSEKLVLPEFQIPNYTYRARVVKVVDGDTIDVDLDVGFETTLRKRLRLMGVNAWETKGKERDKGLEAKRFAEGFLVNGKEIWVQTLMDAKGKYGRVLAFVWREALDTDGTSVFDCLNEQLIAKGHGVAYMTGSK